MVRFVRGHVSATVAGLSFVAGLVITTAEAVGEGWTSPLLCLTGTAIGTGGFFALGMICNAALHIVKAPSRTEVDDNRASATGVRRAGRLSSIAAALALPAWAVLRDSVWKTAGFDGEVDSPEKFAAIAFSGALVSGLVVFCIVLAADASARRCSSRT
jgi:hypothetical protein